MKTKPIRHGSWSLLLSVILVLTNNLYAQDFVYTNDNVAGANTVSGFSVAGNGALTLVDGSPFATGGVGVGGGFFAANMITSCVVGTFLYASNAGSSDVSGFSINPVTGVLTQVPGSPFPVAGGPSLSSISVACTPDRQFVMAANAEARLITVFRVADTGALTPIAGSPFPTISVPDGIKVSPDNNFLAVAELPVGVEMFSIASNGALTPVPGSPFQGGGDPSIAEIAGVDINCASNLLFAGEANAGSTIVDVFDVASNGALAPIPGSPFIPGVGSNSNVVLLSPNDQLLFVSNQNSGSVTVFTVGSGGSLTLVPGSPFSATGDPSGMATDRAGNFLYVADSDNAVYGYSIGSGGALTPVPGSPFYTGQSSGGLFSLTAFPAKACVIPPPVNALVTFEPMSSTFTFTPDATGCPEGFVGTFRFEARLSNISESALTDLVVAVTTLTNDNLLQNAGGGPGGVGAHLTVPQQDGFSDSILSPDEFVDVPFVICLTQQQPFTFVVDVFGVVEASTDAQAKAPLAK